MRYRKLAGITIILVLLVIGAVVFGYYRGLFGHNCILVKSNFDLLPDWEKDTHKEALETLAKSCRAISRLDPNQPFGRSISQSGTVESWQKICSAIGDLKTHNDLSAKRFFEFWFEPYHVYDNFSNQGLFTGYYLPKLLCKLKRSKRYSEPIYAIPSDLVKVNLGLFDKKLSGRTVVGQVKDKQVRPYPNRAAIMRGVIRKKAKVLAWCDDMIDVAFAHIQGSAIVRLSKKKQFLINYDSSNGRPYTAIGKVLIKTQGLVPHAVSMQTIRSWLSEHPKKMNYILNQNESYVFFRVLKNNAPFGSEQVPLTPGRSLAVDRRYIPLGVPVWLDTVIPRQKSQILVPFRHLLIAQDTGGAIKGIIRGDVYWGSGSRAAFIAGQMKSLGSCWILLPKRS